MSQAKAPNPYLRTKIMTATPEELRLMLYEGAIRFCVQARDALNKNDREGSYNALMRAQKIVLELSTSLNHKIAPELCQKLSALYTYIYRRLMDANMSQQTEPVEESIRLLTYEKDTWQMLLQQQAHGQPAGSPPNAPPTAPGASTAAPTSAAAAANLTSAQQTAISSLSVNG